MTITEVDITRLPDATLTPAERAWDAIAYMEAHPDEVEMDSWGTVHPHDETRTIGCFAHHVVKRAGYEFEALDNDRMHVKTPQGRMPVHLVANELLGLPTPVGCLGPCCSDDLFSPLGTVAGRAEMVAGRFGPRPVAA
jgi:hypothetical protein